MKSWTAALILLGAVCTGALSKPAEAQLRWPDLPKRAPMRVRLVAVALAVPRSSFFSSREVFVAETEIEHEEWSLIKLVFNFLPYQPGLLDSGFDYSVVHELTAWRDPDCDETVEQLTARSAPDRHEPLVYSRHVPREDLDRRRIPLACYETDADEYIKASVEPIAPPPEPATPFLKQRSNAQSVSSMEERSNAKPLASFGEGSNPAILFEQSPKAIPFLEQPLISRPKPSLGARSIAKPIPFLDQHSQPRSSPDEGLKPRPIPFFDDGTKPEPLPSLEQASKPQPIPFLDDGSKPEPVPSLRSRATPKPTASPKKRSTPRVISDTEPSDRK